MFIEVAKIGDRESIKPVDPPEFTQRMIAKLVQQNEQIIESNQRLLALLCGPSDGSPDDEVG